MKTLKSVFLVLLVFGILFLAGCGGKKQTADSDANGNVQNKGTSTTDIFGSKPIEYKVGYNVVITMNGETNKFIEKITSKGKDKTRIEIATDKGSIVTYSLGQEDYLCSVEGGKESCMKGPDGASGAGADLTKSIDSIKNQLNQPSTKRTIAGVTATCYKADAMGLKAEACASKEGVPLYLSTESGVSGKTTYEAFEYSTTVTDAEMTPKNIGENIFASNLDTASIGNNADTGNQDLLGDITTDSGAY